MKNNFRYYMQNGLWWLLVLMLPITSLPLVVNLVHSDVVGAPSGVILLILVLVFYIPHILKGRRIPKIVLLIFGFSASALISTVLAILLPIPPFRNVSFIANEGKALITLSIGVCFYLVVSAWCTDEQRLKTTIRLLNWSGLFIILWSFIQAVAWQTLHVYPYWMEVFHRTFSTGVLYQGRVCGFTLEPSWLAHQLNMLYLPLWLAFTVQKNSVHSFRLFKVFSFENMLLVGGILTMFLSLSRIGWLAFLTMIAYLIWGLAGKIVYWFQNRINSHLHFRNKNIENHLHQKLLLFAVGFSFVLVGISLLVGVAQLFKHFDPRMEDVFNFQLTRDNPVMWYAEQLDFGPRVTYWLVGWKVFESYPLMGVGLGNTGYFMPQFLSAYGWHLPEVRTLMFQSGNLINSKNLWIRLLAETGLVGFLLFVIWLYAIWYASKCLKAFSWTGGKIWRSIGLAGLFIVIGLIFEGFSVDTFALPYFWFSFGLVTAGFGRLFSGENTRILLSYKND